MDSDYLDELQNAQRRVENTIKALEQLGDQLGYQILVSSSSSLVQEKSNRGENSRNTFSGNAIYDALLKISPALANSYAQVKNDLEDPSRMSWAGTAHEIRQVLSTLLHVLAPDDKVEAQANFQLEKGTSKPTQKQRVLYIMRQQNADSSAQEVVEKVVHLEDMVGDTIRSIYSRASDAAHTFKDKKEVTRILKYFEAFAPELLNIDS